MKLKDLKMSKKLSIIYGLITVLFAIAMVISLFGQSASRNSYEQFYKANYQHASRAHQIRINLQKTIKFLSLSTAEDNIVSINSYIDETNLCLEAIEEHREWFKDSDTIKENEMLDQLSRQMEAAMPVQGQIVELVLENTDASRAEARKILTDEYVPLIDIAAKSLENFGEAVDEAGDEAYADAMKIQSALIVISVIVAFVALVTSVVLSAVLRRSILKPINELQGIMGEIGKGNLKAEIDYQSDDELGDLAERMREMLKFLQMVVADQTNILVEIENGNFDIDTKNADTYRGDFYSFLTSIRNLRDKLSDTIYQINVTGDQVASGADQVSSGAQALSQGATEQASSVEELAVTISDISTRVNVNAERATEASNKAIVVGNQMTESNQRMQEMLKAMTDISNSSGEISKIIKTIEDIAFQTNILALNAAVEAARAGEAGKGFAVVADEVRNLAGKSAEASKNTSSLIEGSLKAVRSGIKIANETAQALDSAVSGVNDVTVMIEQISGANGEQAISINQITQGIDQISSVIQTNSATAEEGAAASEELTSQVQILKNLVSQFKLMKKHRNFSYGAPAFRGGAEMPASSFSNDKYDEYIFND